MARRLGWYARRLARMSPAEILHRLGEWQRKFSDGRGQWGWEVFGRFEGGLHGLPGMELCVIPPAIIDSANQTALDFVQAKLCFLGQDWPVPNHLESWWTARDFWSLDPVTNSSWGGQGVFAFRVPYRHVTDKGDVKFVWEPNRLQFMPALALASRHDAQAGQMLQDVLRSWMNANPPYDGINWTGGIEAASRVVSLLAALALVDDSQRETLDVLLRPFFEAHFRWLARYPSLYSSANNHRVSELAALFLLNLCAPGIAGVAEQKATAKASLEDEMGKQFFADGVGAEQSPTYAAYSLEWFLLAGMAAEAAGEPFSAIYRERIYRAADHLRWMMDEAGHVPHIGDDDEGRVLALSFDREARYVASVVALAARWLKVADLMPPVADVALRDLMVSGETAATSRASGPVGERIFEQGGYAVMRRDTDNGVLLAVFDHGPLGFLAIAAHGHADVLSVWLHWGEEAVLVDAGTYLYHSGGAWRDRFRGTSAHNTLTINGNDQSHIAGAFNWSRHAAVKLVETGEGRVVAEHDGYLSAFGFLHRRSMSCDERGEVLIEDSLIGTAQKEPLIWSIGFLLAPDIECIIEDNVAHLTTRAGRCLSFTIEGEVCWQLEEAPYSSAFNNRGLTKRLVTSGHISAGGGTVCRTRITPA